ncbi:LR74B-like protein [Mya arenaria]|uniref:LR74B-like protein n=1 Tax=Mya arenaria TaxID=6604 RepID=A0ABY7FD21_MYAAR|nr:LR74B-like protein [Mya arenaria]
MSENALKQMQNGRWDAYKEKFEEQKTRRAMARKLRIKYERLCAMRGSYPLTAVCEQLEEDTFDIGGQHLGPAHWKIVAIILLKAEWLTGLDVRDNCLGTEGAFTIADFVSVNRTLSKLNVADNGIGVAGLKALASAVIDNVLVTHLDLSGNEISDEGAKPIAEIIEARTGLMELRMNHNCVREEGAIAIGHALAQNENITSLDLSWNHVRCKGAIALSNSLKTNESLRTLELAWNGFGKEGAGAMGEALAENGTLRALDLTNNRIDGNGMALLMLGLRQNDTLESLKVGQNPFNSDVAKHLLLILEKAENSAITHLEMSEVAVDEEFMEVLERLSGRGHLHVKHGKFTRKVPVKKYVPPPPPQRDPITQMFDYKYERGYRTLDLLMHLDKDNNMVIDRTELTDGLMFKKSVAAALVEKQGDTDATSAGGNTKGGGLIGTPEIDKTKT